MTYITPSILFAIFALALAAFFLVRYSMAARAMQEAPKDPRWVGEAHPPRLSFAGTCHPMEKKDRLPLLLITFIYALTAFFQLGDLSGPVEPVDFAGGNTVTVEVQGSMLYTTGIRYFTCAGTGGYNVEISTDGEYWSTLWQRHDDSARPDKITGWYWANAAGYSPSYALSQKYNEVYKWNELTVENPQNVRYIRITGRAEKPRLELGRLCFLSGEGEVLSFDVAMADGSPVDSAVASLFAGEAPDKSTWHNSTYFDEIYHARTAKEHIDNVYPYEITHPPLGKLILGLGIRLFGMTPFGWRFSGTFFGVLMLPLLYIFLKNMFGKTIVAACGATLFAAEFMHLTQTRISTIDTYAVFFILCMYFFLYRYLTLPAGTTFKKGALPLLLSGLMWGLGASSKWTVIYAGLGLAVVYFMGFYQKLRDWPAELRSQRTGWVVKTLLFSVLCFILLPFAIYLASYIPYALAKNVPVSLEGLGQNLGLLLHNVAGRFSQGEDFAARSIPTDTLSGIMANNQWYMLTYHQGVSQSHPYSSWWFQWLVDARPILYYMDNTVAGHTTRFAAFSNPLICWTGLGAILICAAHSFRRTWAKALFLGGLGAFSAVMVYKVQHTPNGVFDADLLSPTVLTRNLVILIACLVLYLVLAAVLLRAAPGYDSRAAFILVGYLAQLVPWMFIGRTTFEYHYFPSILFLVFALAYLINGLLDGDRDWNLAVYPFTGAAVVLYAVFYPVLIGLQIPTWYESLVKWIESWPF